MSQVSKEGRRKNCSTFGRFFASGSTSWEDWMRMLVSNWLGAHFQKMKRSGQRTESQLESYLVDDDDDDEACYPILSWCLLFRDDIDHPTHSAADFLKGAGQCLGIRSRSCYVKGFSVWTCDWERPALVVFSNGWMQTQRPPLQFDTLWVYSSPGVTVFE